MTPGLYVALMGIDGSGKSTVAARVRDRLTHEGHEVVEAGTEAVLAAARSGYGYPWESLSRIASEGWRLYLDSPRQSGVLTSGLLEFAAHYVIRVEVIGPALDRGAVVISDSFGFKNVLKSLRQAQAMPGELKDMIEGLAVQLGAAMSDSYLQPHVGLLLDADSALTYGWRMSQRGTLEEGADLAVAGHSGRESFLDFQGHLAKEFREKATQWGWSLLPVDGRPIDDTVDAALRCVMSHPRLQGQR